MAPSHKDTISPAALCHVVLRTSPENYQNMVNWYVAFLGGRITHAGTKLTLIAYDYEHHRIAIVATPNVATKEILRAAGRVSSLGHFAFGFKTMMDLAIQYEQKISAGLKPSWVVNHGMCTSMYWEDPDGNECETQVDNFETAEETIAYMEGEEFAKNPIGVEFDPDEFVRKVKAGISDKELKKRPDVGVRTAR
jgi:catechol-2,3-dioxygenase